MLTDAEAWMRPAAFVLVLALLAAAEVLRPRRTRTLPRRRRWPANLGILAIDAALLRLLLPAAAIGAAVAAERHGFGLLNATALPAWIAVPVAVVALDLVIWAQHVLFHRIPVLWRLHRVHHADRDLDVTTGLRFHPLEILASMAIKMAAVALLGAPAAAVVLFELLLNAAAMFNHANLALPAGLDRRLRRFLVTPDMHRVHHSVHRDETDRNFGFALSWWDRVFGTYRDRPRDGHAGMAIGTPGFDGPSEERLDRMLTQPFRQPVSIAGGRTLH
ncbi:sterol desaturase family protein [Stella sp.]|uniref:sterol desaturase family protein n=1 Tax=Stella sp. TaxID=2912054 RepID=UPI0035AE206B